MTGSRLAGLQNVDRAVALLDRLVDELEASASSLDSVEESLDDLLEGGVMDVGTAAVLRSVREEVRGTLVLTEESRREVGCRLVELEEEQG